MNATQYQLPVDSGSPLAVPLEITSRKTGGFVAADGTPTVSNVFVNGSEFSPLTDEVSVSQLGTLDGRYQVEFSLPALEAGDTVLVYGTVDVNGKTYSWSKAAIAVDAVPAVEGDVITVS